MSPILSLHLPQLGGSMNVKHPFLHSLLSLPVKMSAAHNVPVWNTTASSEQMHLNTGLLVKWIIHKCSCHEAKGIWTRSEPGKNCCITRTLQQEHPPDFLAQCIRNGFWLISMCIKKERKKGRKRRKKGS